MSILTLEELGSAKLVDLTPKDVCYSFVMKSTVGKYFFDQQEIYLGPFCHLLDKAKIYEVVEVKRKLVAKGETIRYWDPTDMSR